MISKRNALQDSAKIERRLPPKTVGLPVAGSLFKFLKDPLKFLIEARANYGDIYSLDLGVTDIVILNHPRQADYVLRKNFRNYNKGGAMWKTVRTVLGNGLGTSEGDFWRRQRRMIQPLFHRKHLNVLTDMMVDVIDEQVTGWQGYAKQKPFNVAHALHPITMKVIVKTMFGTGIDDEDLNAVSQSAAFINDYIPRGMLTSFLPAWIPLPGRHHYATCIRTVDRVVQNVIERRRQLSDHNHSDLLTMMLHTEDAETGERMTDKQLRDEAVTMFLSGYDTTAGTLTWVFHILTQYPEVTAKLQKEVDEILGKGRPSLADLSQLTYSRMVIQETMRLYPPLWWVSRTATEDDEIDGFYIKAGTMVAPMPYVIHRHPAIWDNPNKFDPERFSRERFKARHKLAWLPFGAGQRQCIGRDFSIMESQLILARILQNYKITAVPGNVAQLKVSTTLKTQKGVFINLEQR